MRECFIMKGYISNQVTMIVIELSSNTLERVNILYCGKIWSTFILLTKWFYSKSIIADKEFYNVSREISNFDEY